MEKLTSTFKLFTDETSLRIIILLFQKDLCVCQIAGITEVSQPNISKKLAALRKMDFVTTEKKSLYTFYTLNTDDQLFINIIKDIVDNIKSYPILNNDIEKSMSANKFIEQQTCSSN